MQINYYYLKNNKFLKSKSEPNTDKYCIIVELARGEQGCSRHAYALYAPHLQETNLTTAAATTDGRLWMERAAEAILRQNMTALNFRTQLAMRGKHMVNCRR